MSLISANNLALSFIEKDIFNNVSFIIEEKNKIGLVGVNGAGKTSLFKLLTGALKPTEGELYIAKNCKIGIMEQHLQATADCLFDELLTVFTDLIQAESRLDDITKLITDNPQDLDRLIKEQNRLHEYFIGEGGLVYQSRVRATLLGLGFTEADFAMDVEKLSGGQRSKLSLAKLLLAKADLLLLDEPTNHLDIHAVEWLEDFLKSYEGTYIVISHDRYFLDQVTTETYDLENRHLKPYKGNYSVFLDKKAKEREVTLRHNENLEREIKRVEGIIEQQKRWGREKNIVTAASKQKSVDRLADQLVEVENQPKQIHFGFQTQATGGNDVLVCQNLSKAFGDKKLFQNIDLLIKKGEKLFLLGENGTGKSTLFKIIMDEIAADTGEVKVGANIQIGYFDQIQKLFYTENNVLDEIWNSFPKLSETEIRKALAAFLFVDKDLEKPCTVLSGGERAKLGILKIMLSGSNFLLLDEPTNHLDIASREALEIALKDYEGTIIAISHDRFFINKLASRIINLDHHTVTEYLGSYDYYLEKKALLVLDATATGDDNQKKEASANKEDYQARKEQASKIRKLNTRLVKLEAAISQLEAEQTKIETKLADPKIAADYEQTLSLSQELDNIKTAAEGAMEEWAEVSLERESYPAE